MQHAKPLLAPDLLKAFGIILVVFGHLLRGLFPAGILPETEPWISIDRLIYLFHMPLFFYAAGLFLQPMFEKYGYKGLVRRSALVLLAPLIVWSYLQFSLQYAAGGSANYERKLIDVITAPFPPRQQFWFLAVLFAMTASAPLVFKLRQSRTVIWTLISLSLLLQAVFWGDIVRTMAFNVPVFLVMQAFVHLPFLLLGIVWNTEKMESVKLPVLAGIFAFALALTAYYFFPNSGFVHMIASVICVLAAYKIALGVTDGRSGKRPILSTLVFVGMNSMIIYLAHVICMAGFRVFLLKMDIDNAAVHVAGGFFVGLLLPLLLVPVGLLWAQRQPNLARAVLPVRIERK